MAQGQGRAQIAKNKEGYVERKERKKRMEGNEAEREGRRGKKKKKECVH